MEEITAIKVYWDTQDSAREGWAYTVYGAERIIESGPLDDEDRDSNPADLVVNVAWGCGLEITSDQCTCKPSDNGGWAEWTRND